MKLLITILILAANFFILACSKTRTCSCKSEVSTAIVTTPRSSAQPSTTISNSSDETNNTLSHVKKKDMKGCNSRVQTSTATYTREIIENNVSTVADVVSTTSSEYSCEIR